MARSTRIPRSRKAARSLTVARPGAAKSLPLQLVARLPLIGRFASAPASAQAPPQLSPRGLIRLLRARREPEPATGLELPFVTPVLRRVRQPLVKTARVVQTARELRRPRTRWERLREAALRTVQDPASVARLEHWVGLGAALSVVPAAQKPAPRSALARLLRVPAPEPPPEGWLGRLRSLGARHAAPKKATRKKNGPGKLRGRRSKP